MKLSTPENKFKSITLTLESIHDVKILASLCGAITPNVAKYVVSDGEKNVKNMMNNMVNLFGHLADILEQHNIEVKKVNVNIPEVIKAED